MLYDSRMTPLECLGKAAGICGLSFLVSLCGCAMEVVRHSTVLTPW